ncbi:hypothetical protein ACJX0J_015893, partial [Zea mays]
PEWPIFFILYFIFISYFYVIHLKVSNLYILYHHFPNPRIYVIHLKVSNLYILYHHFPNPRISYMLGEGQTGHIEEEQHVSHTEGDRMDTCMGTDEFCEEEEKKMRTSHLHQRLESLHAIKKIGQENGILLTTSLKHMPLWFLIKEILLSRTHTSKLEIAKKKKLGSGTMLKALLEAVKVTHNLKVVNATNLRVETCGKVV